MRLSVVIPMYNEEKIISQNLRTLLAFLSGHLPEKEFEVIAVNDGSTDGTAEQVLALTKTDPALRLLSYPQNRGKGHALKQGMTAAKGDFVLFTDSDLAYGCPMILTFLEDFESGKGQVILGSRAICKNGYEGYTWLRKFASKCYLRIVQIASKVEFSDSQCGIKGFSRDLAHTLFGNLQTDGFAFDLEILLAAKKLSAVFYEQPVKVLTHDSSTVHPVKDALKMLRDLRKIR